MPAVDDNTADDRVITPRGGKLLASDPALPFTLTIDDNYLSAFGGYQSSPAVGGSLGRPLGSWFVAPSPSLP